MADTKNLASANNIKSFRFFFFLTLPIYLQALEDHTIRHAKIVEALEAEKQKIAEEIHSLQKNHGSGNKSMMSMYIQNVAKAVLASLFLSGHGQWVQEVLRVILDKKSLLVVTILSIHKLYVLDCVKSSV